MSAIITPVCRLCLEVIAEDKTFYNIDQQNGLPVEVQSVQNIRDIIKFCIPEVDTYLSMDPCVCDTCLNNLVQIYNYKKCFMKVEAIIRRHCKVNNPVGVSYVDLCKVVKQQYALALKNKRLPPATIQAQMVEMDLVLQNTRTLVPAVGLNVMAQNYSDKERRATPSSSKTSNNKIPSKYSLRHHVPGLLAASSSRPQPPIDLDNPQNSFLGSLNLISSESPSTSDQAPTATTGNKKAPIRKKAYPKKKRNPAAPVDDTIVILDDDSDVECSTNNVETSKNKSPKSDDNNEVLVMNYVEENRATGPRSTATAVSDPATIDIPESPTIAANPTPAVLNLDGKSVTAATMKTVADKDISAADTGTPASTDKLGSSVIAAADTKSAATDDAVTNVVTGADVSAVTFIGNTTPGVIELDDKSSKSTPTPVSSASEKPKTMEKSVVVKLLPVNLDDLKRKVAGKKCHEEEIPSKRKKVLTVNLNPSLPYLHKNKKLIVKIAKQKFSTCEICDYVTNQGKDAIKQHGLRKHKVCMLCDFQCGSALLLNKHIHNHHFEEATLIVDKSKEENDTIICDLCSYKAVSGFDFRDHVVKKHCVGDGGIDYKCPYENCGLKYSQTFNLARHVEIHHVLAKKMTCVICNQKCPSKKSLRIHLQSHKPSGIICLLCGMSFRSTSLLRNHTKNKHPGIDTESNIAGMAHDSHENLTADDNGHITLDSFVNRNVLSNEETGANRGTLTTDENGRIVLNLPRPNPLVADPNLVVNLEERCSFEYPSLSEMLCESSFLQQNQEDECALVDNASKPKITYRKRKRFVPRKTKKRKVSKVQDDIDDCMIIDKEIVTVDVSDEEALLITDSDDDCTIVIHQVATASETDSDKILPDATADSTKESIGNAKKLSENKNGNIVISDSESEDSNSVEDDLDTNSEEHSKTINLETEISHKDNQNKVESIIENTNSKKSKEAKENNDESPSTSNDKGDEDSAILQLRNISKKCTEVIIGANKFLKGKVTEAGENYGQPPRSSNESLKEHNNPDNSEICTASNELLNDRLSDDLEPREPLSKIPESKNFVDEEVYPRNLESEKSSENIDQPTNVASELLEEKVSENLESSSNKPSEHKRNSENQNLEKSSEKVAESTNNSHEPLTRKYPENIDLEESDTSADAASVLNALLGDNSSESEMSSESLNISDALLKENMSDNLESEESPVKTGKTFELCSNDRLKNKAGSKNLEPEQYSEKSTNSSNKIPEDQITENMKLGDAKTTISGSNSLLMADVDNVELVDSEQLEGNIDSKNLETEKCSENTTSSSNEILNELTESIKLLKTSAKPAECSSNELLKEIVIVNMEFEKSSENIAESSLNKLLQEVGSENLGTEKEKILGLDGFAVMDDDSATSLNPQSKEKEYSKSETTKRSNELLNENVSEKVADSVSTSYELLTETNISNDPLTGNNPVMADNFESSVAIDLPTSTNELLKETISEFFDMKKFTDMYLESARSSNDLLREDNEMSNNVESSKIVDGVYAKLTTNSSNEVAEDLESPRVNLACQSDSTNDVIASTFNSIEQLRIILEDA